MRALHCHGARPCAAFYRFHVVIISALIDFEIGKDLTPRLIGRRCLNGYLRLLHKRFDSLDDDFELRHCRTFHSCPEKGEASFAGNPQAYSVQPDCAFNARPELLGPFRMMLHFSSAFD
jgi:hypothetical protein